MMELVLNRIETSVDGTIGRLVLPDGEELATMEPPWRENRRGLSCLPPGEYSCIWRQSPRYGRCYWLQDTQPRTFVLIHSGNLGGDTERGLKTHTKGCILPGLRAGRLGGQRAVLASKAAVRRLYEALGGVEFVLTIDGGTEE